MYLAIFTSSVALHGINGEATESFYQVVPETYAAAEQSAGFVWRAAPEEVIFDESGKMKRFAYEATPSFYEDRDNVLQTLSVWKDLSTAWNYVYSGTHLSQLRRRSEWMAKPIRAQYVLWWIEDDSMPTHVDGVQRLELLDQAGPTPAAFNFRNAFSSTGEPVASLG